MHKLPCDAPKLLTLLETGRSRPRADLQLWHFSVRSCLGNKLYYQGFKGTIMSTTKSQPGNKPLNIFQKIEFGENISLTPSIRSSLDVECIRDEHKSLFI